MCCFHHQVKQTLCLSTYWFDSNPSSDVSSSISSSEKLPSCGAEKRWFRVIPSPLKYCSVNAHNTLKTRLFVLLSSLFFYMITRTSMLLDAFYLYFILFF